MKEKNNASEPERSESSESNNGMANPSSEGPNTDRLVISVIICITLFIVMYVATKLLGL